VNNMAAYSNVQNETVGGLTDSSTYYGIAGLVVGGVLGTGLTMIPVVGTIGILRTLLTIGLGGWLIGTADATDFGRGKLFAGSALLLSAITQVASGSTFNAPNLPQSGSGSIIGQETPHASYSDIKNAEGETLPNAPWMAGPMTADMQDRQIALEADPMASEVVPAPLGHGVTQYYAEEDIEYVVGAGTNVDPMAPLGSNTPFLDQVTPLAPSGGVTQDLGGSTPEPSTQTSPIEQDVGDFVASVDTMGWRAMNLNKASMFITSKYPGGNPPISYGADQIMLPAGGLAMQADTLGSMPDVLGSYHAPGTTATPEAYILGSHTQSYSNQATMNLGAENHRTTLSRHVYKAEGQGSVIGQ
jgi:hypothetical protein